MLAKCCYGNISKVYPCAYEGYDDSPLKLICIINIFQKYDNNMNINAM